LHKRWSAYYLAAALALMAVFSMVPGVNELLYHFQNDDAPVYGWAYLVLLIGIVELAYALYLFQLPDWSSIWVVTLATLLIATAYAMLLAVVLLARDDSRLLVSLQLTAAHLPKGRVTLWCLMMVSLTSLLTYFCGRVGVRWQTADRLLAAATEDKRAER
jgi:hypothetical protein